MYSVYQLKVGKDKVYYGMTKDPVKRLRAHEKQYRMGETNPLYEAMAGESYTMTVIQSNLSKEDALLFEDLLIRSARQLNMFTVLNLANSGKRPFADCPEVIARMSEAHKELLRNRPDLCKAQSERAKVQMQERLANGWKPNITEEARNRQVESRKRTCESNPEIRVKAIEVLNAVREKSMRKISRPIINLDTSEIFSSITEAAKSIGVNQSSMSEAVKDGRKCKSFMFVRLYTGTL